MKPIHLLPLTILLAAGLACGHAPKEAASVLPVAKVRLAASQASGAGSSVAMTLTATQRATVATRMAATVKRVLVNEGQHVGAGALLVSLSDDDLQGGLKAAEAAVAAAQVHMQRMDNLARQNAAVPAEVDMARVQLAQARAGLASVKANLSYTQIRAPFAGVVQVRRVNEGDLVGPGMPLVELEGQGALEFTGTVSEVEARGLKIGQVLPFEAEGQTGTVQLTGLATGGDPVTHRAALRAKVVKGPKDLRTGTFGRLKLPGTAKAPEGVTVPRTALVQRGELSGVFVARDGKAELRWLSLGEAMGDRLPVRAGLSERDLVIDTPGELRDGQPIEVLK